MSPKTQTVSKLNQLPEEFSEDDIISWIQECYSLNLKVDINRLARFAMGRNALTALKYLVDKEKADLSSTDICGRTAIFYALWDYPNTQMFAYIKSKVSPKSEILNCQDTVKQFTALDYAILSNKLDAIELLLTLGANTRGKDTWMRKPWYMQSLFGLNDLAGTVPEFCILGVLPRPSFRGRFYHTLGEIHMDLYSSLFDDLELSLPLLWVHLPWTNVWFRNCR
jgi:hypothetical protein